MPEPARIGRVKFLSGKWATRMAARAAADHSAPKDADPFELLLDADPSPRREYLDWICRIYDAGNILLEDRERVRNTLVLFHRWKRRLPVGERDVGRHPTEQSVWAAVEQFDPSRATEDPEPEGRELRRVERAKALAESEVCESERLGGWIVASPRTVFAAQWWGRGTRWCTAMKSGIHFRSYSERGPLRVFVAPDGRKFQAHVATGSCCNAEDRPVGFSDFVKGLPKPGVETLKDDVKAMLAKVPDGKSNERTSHQDFGVITSIPEELLEDEVRREFVARGLGRVQTKAEHGDWKLKLVCDPLAKWALGLITSKPSWRNPDFLVLEGPAGLRVNAEMDQESAKAFREIGRVLCQAPAEFMESAVLDIAELWESRGGYRSAAELAAVIENLPPGSVPREAWLCIARKWVKKKRDWHDFAIPHQFVDDEIADVLAQGCTLAAIPPSMVTKPRIMTILSKHPVLANTELETYGAGHTMDRDLAMAIASWRSGEGLACVPAEIKTREFCLEALAKYPRAIKFVPEEHLTHEICCAVIDQSALMLEGVPEKFRDRELYRRAVLQSGGILSQVPMQYRDVELCRAALATNPDQFSHVTIPLAYEEFLKGVSISGSLLARVPLEYRDAGMCLAAVRKQMDAQAHVPPLVGAALKADPEHRTLMGHFNGRLSSRYPKTDPIYTFEPPAERPEKLPPIQARADGGIASGPRM